MRSKIMLIGMMLCLSACARLQIANTETEEELPWTEESSVDQAAYTMETVDAKEQLHEVNIAKTQADITEAYADDLLQSEPVFDVYLVETEGFWMYIEEVFAAEEEIIIIGTIQEGILQKADALELIDWEQGIHEVELLDLKTVDGVFAEQAERGQRVELVTKDIEQESLQKGQILATKGTMKITQEVSALFHLYTGEESGISMSPLKREDAVRVRIHKEEVDGIVSDVIDETGDIQPGGIGSIEITLSVPVAVKEGMSFTVLTVTEEQEAVIGEATVIK